MAEHRVPKGNIIYIIPTDELFIKYKNNEAFIDEYGRLMNRKPHRVLKELKHYVADSEMQESYASTLNQRKNAFYSIFQVIRLRKFILQVCLLPIKVICQCNIMTLSQSD